MASLADLLDYDQRKKQALQALTDYASSQYKLGSAFGEGLSDQAKGLVQMVMHPIDTATQMYQAGKAVVQNPKAAYQAAKEGLAETVSSPQNIARFAGQNFNPLELANALNKVGTMRELTVYHGTPHTLPPTANNPLGEFDASKIGTGEGAAAYGHGIYTAQRPEIAETYRKRQPPMQFRGQELGKVYDNLINQINRTDVNSPKYRQLNEKYQVLEDIGAGISHDHLMDRYLHSAEKGEFLPETQEFVRSIKPSETDQSSLYKIDLPDEKIDQMLDWDKPLSQQSAHVQKILAKIDPDAFHVNGPDYDANELGHNIYLRLSNSPLAKTQEEASILLKAQGIPGIKYFDNPSRDAASGSRNFVVFPGEEKNLKILSRE